MFQDSQDCYTVSKNIFIYVVNYFSYIFIMEYVELLILTKQLGNLRVKQLSSIPVVLVSTN